MPKKEQETDEKFALRFEAFGLDFNTEWGRNHYNHIRLAWWYLRLHGLSGGIQAIQYHFKRYHRRNNAKRMYNETITQFWARLVWARMNGVNHDTFAEFVAEHEDVANYGTIFEYYSYLTLFSDRAKDMYIQPDKKDI